MSKDTVIAWKAANGQAKTGTTKFTAEDAKRICADYNRRHATIHHYPVTTTEDA